MVKEWQDCGVVILCKSIQMSKFKLVLFDKDGGVRMIEESNKKKGCTSAELYFVPFRKASMSEFIPLKFYMEDKDTPLPFHYLDTLEMVSARTLEDREHILCVYGDNWLMGVKYQLRLLPLNNSSNTQEIIKELCSTEDVLLNKRESMAKFQSEYMDAERAYKAAVERLKRETDEIKDLLKKRERAYEELEKESSAPFAAKQVNSSHSGKGLFSNWF
ncbi:hypothetical protein AB6A40_011449 [Gnathostoma spinigerum]|uniref:Uncharacterized protein n=1 Tax=Gnathostoma spinigerum TaxID=75299 RepID=A0ABD6EXQ9_9BILA